MQNHSFEENRDIQTILYKLTVNYKFIQFQFSAQTTQIFSGIFTNEFCNFYWNWLNLNKSSGKDFPLRLLLRLLRFLSQYFFVFPLYLSKLRLLESEFLDRLSKNLIKRVFTQILLGLVGFCTQTAQIFQVYSIFWNLSFLDVWVIIWLRRFLLRLVRFLLRLVRFYIIHSDFSKKSENNLSSLSKNWKIWVIFFTGLANIYHIIEWREDLQLSHNVCTRLRKISR